MKCPKCGKVLMKTNDGSYICSPECGGVYSEQDLRDAQMIEEDMEIWKSSQKFGGRE